MELRLNSGGTLSVADAVFAAPYNESLVHQVVVAYQAAGRAGTRAQKTRAEVRGGGRKPWKQKGTGRARAGTIRSPIWRGGGITFAAAPQDHSQKVNRKMYRGAMRAILGELVRQDRLVLVDSLVLEAPKTRLLLDKLRLLGIAEAMIVLEQDDRHIDLAMRNVVGLDCCAADGVDPVRLLAYDKILMTVAAAKRLEERLA